MRVTISQGERVPIRRSTTVKSHPSKTDCHNVERIREDNLLAFIDEILIWQQKDVQTNDYDNVDEEDHDLQQRFVAENRNRPDCNISSHIDPAVNDSLGAGLCEVPNIVKQPEMDLNRPAGDIQGNSKQMTRTGNEMSSGVPENFAGPKEVVQLLSIQDHQERLMLLELQEQLLKLKNVIYQRQTRQRQEQWQVQITQELAIKEDVTTEVQPIKVETGNDSTNNLSSVCTSNQLNSRRPDSVQDHVQSNDNLAADAEHPGKNNRVDKFETSSPKKKQVLSNARVKKSNLASGKNPTVCVESKTYSCAECDKAFIRKSDLIRHLRIHSEKPFECGVCGVTFYKKSNSTRHQMIHSGEKPFKCQICDVAFNRKFDLSRHLLIHTNEKPFGCDICKRSFRRKHHLVNHMNIHSGQKPYKCNVCEKAFRVRSNLSKHRTIHTKRDW